MIWNDDAKMLNKGWDIEIDSYSEHPMPVLKMPVKDFEHAFALFPIVTKNWISVFGCLSLYKDLDRFTYNVACNTADGIFLKLNSTILHDRADITGNNNDATYAASKQVYISTDPSSPFSDDYPMAIRILVVIGLRLNSMNARAKDGWLNCAKNVLVPPRTRSWK